MTTALAKLPEFVPPGDVVAAVEILDSCRFAASNAAWTICEQAYLAGKVLVWVKSDDCEEVGHGEFLPWLADNFPMSVRTADYLMSFARNCDKAASLLPYSPSKFATIANIMPKQLPHVAQATGENEWYTPPKYTDAARAVMGGIDCDPASSKIANENVKAETFYTVEDDGRDKQWGERVWMNPPYVQPLVAEFAAGLVKRVKAGEVQEACVLVNNATETDFFQALLGVASSVCFPRARIRFLDADGNATGAPLQGQAVIYVGENAAAFYDHFSPFGAVLNVP